MLTLLLLRHAKSSWDDPELDDFDRPLAKRGVKAARQIGEYLAAEKLKPDFVLCSPSVRTRATLALVLSELSQPPPGVNYADDLYLASPAVWMDHVHRIESRPQRLMFVGHNPGMHALTLALTGRGGREELREAATKFPTATLAVLTFKVLDWTEVTMAAGRLERFITPRNLP